MRIFIPVAIMIGLFIGFGMPVPVVTREALPPDADLPSFAAAAEQLPDRRQEAALPPGGGENPERRRLRHALLRAANQLDTNPCDKGKRQKFIAAARPYIDSIENGPPEMAMINGKQRSLSKKFDKPATDALFKMFMKGYIDPRELGGPQARFFARDAPVGAARKALCNG